MNFDDDLAAPVWDELDSPNTTVSPGLANTFATLSTNEPNIFGTKVEDEDENEEPVPEEEEPLQKKESNHNLPIEHNLPSFNDVEAPMTWGNEPIKENTENLLNTLAPDNDLLSDLKTANITSPRKGIDEPLFSGSIYSPLNVDEDEEMDRGVIPDVLSSEIKNSRKPQILFNSARLRRRPLSPKDQKTLKTTVSVSDPLGEAQAKNEFVDEPLENAGTIIDSKNNNILSQIEEPLFNISPKKSIVKSNDKKVTHEHNDNADNIESKEKPLAKEAVKFDVEVRDPVKIGELTGSHVEYTVQATSELLEGKYSQVNRRYTDFRWLYRQLQNNHWGKIIPPPPEKQSVGRFKQDFIENRRFQMERMLSNIANDPELQDDPDFLLFLTSSSFTVDSKTREHYTGSGASNDSNDLSEIHMSEIELLGPEDAAVVFKTGGLDGELNRSFMSLSFTSQPKYVENDEYFIEQRKATEILEEQLKQLYRSLELVDSERTELALVTDEFSNTIDSFAQFEITKRSSELLHTFADVHRRIKESLQRNSLQESVTLGVTLDEYVRSLSSVKAIFNQRAKLGYYLVIVENDFTKSKAQLDKISNSKNTERFQTAKVDYDVLQKRYRVVKSKWLQIGEKIKEEVGSYEHEKVTEFRNNMEIFLESSIESQKECIELWETFYQNNL